MKWSSSRTSIRARASLQTPGDRLRLPGWAAASRGVIVRDDDGGGVVQQALADDFARVDARAIDSAPKDLLESEQPVAIVQEQAAKDLIVPIPQLREQEAAGRLRGGQR